MVSDVGATVKSIAMPKCRRDQRTFAICLVVMVTVETLLIFTVMHQEHLAAEEDAEQRREERRRAMETEDISEEGEKAIGELSLEEEWAEGLVRKNRVASQIRQNEKSRQTDSKESRLSRDASIHKASHDERFFGDNLGENPKIRGVVMAKAMSQGDIPSEDDAAWIAEKVFPGDKWVFVKDIPDVKKHLDKLSLTRESRSDSGPKERLRLEHAAGRPRPQVINLYKDVNGL